MNIEEFDTLVRSRALNDEAIKEGIAKIFNTIISNDVETLKHWIDCDILWSIIEMEQSDAFGTEGMKL